MTAPSLQRRRRSGGGLRSRPRPSARRRLRVLRILLQRARRWRRGGCCACGAGVDGSTDAHGACWQHTRQTCAALASSGLHGPVRAHTKLQAGPLRSPRGSDGVIMAGGTESGRALLRAAAGLRARAPAGGGGRARGAAAAADPLTAPVIRPSVYQPSARCSLLHRSGSSPRLALCSAGRPASRCAWRCARGRGRGAGSAGAALSLRRCSLPTRARHGASAARSRAEQLHPTGSRLREGRAADTGGRAYTHSDTRQPLT